MAVEDIGERAATELTGPVPPSGATIELVGDLRSLSECRQLLRNSGLRVRHSPIPTWMSTAMVGREFVDVWRWMTTIAPDEIELTAGLRDVPAWISELTGHSEPVAARRQLES